MDTFLNRKGYFMSEENTIMERLFHKLDDKAKTLNKENGQSFIENLGLAMEDIYVTIEYNGDEIYEHSSYYENADGSFSYDFVPDINLSFSNPTNGYTISLYDHDDFDVDDFMGGINFIPYVTNTNFSPTLSLDAAGDVAFELSVEYIF